MFTQTLLHKIDSNGVILWEIVGENGYVWDETHDTHVRDVILCVGG